MPLRDDLLNPIAGDNPSGPNLRYDAQIDKIKEARREELDIDQGDWKTAIKTADHKLVIKLASEVLAKRSKDLQVAVWLVEAHVRQEGFPLVASCFRLIKDLLDQFWDGIHPEIDEGDLELRATPLEWLGSKLAFHLKELPLTTDKLSWHKFQESRLVGYEEAVGDDEIKAAKRNALIAEHKLTPEEFDDSVAGTPLDFLDAIALELDESLAALEELNQFCEEKFGDATPGFRVTREGLEEIAQTLRLIIKAKEKDQPRPESEAASSDESPAPEEDFGMQISSELDAEAEQEIAARSLKGKSRSSAGVEPVDMEDAALRLAAICRYFRTQNEVDVAPYLIIRGFRWGEIRYAAPPVRDDLLEPPPTELRVKLKKLNQQNDWNTMITVCEEAMALPCGRAWLDLQRFAIIALDGRGFNEIVTAIRSTMRGLLEDLPELLDLTFSDDTPTANEETKKWIESFIMKKDEPAPAAPAEGSEETPSEDSASTDDSSLSSDESTPTGDLGLDLGSTDTDSASTDAASEPAPEEPLPEPPPPIDLSETPPLLDEMAMETPEPPESVEPTVEGVDEGPKDIFDQAIAAVRGGNTREGIDLINKVLATERSGRARFKRRTQIAHLLVAAGQEQIAKPILTQLSGEIDERKLDEWEDGDAIAYNIELLLRCLVKDAGETERRTELYAKMCRLDPVRALNHSYVNG